MLKCLIKNLFRSKIVRLNNGYHLDTSSFNQLRGLEYVSIGSGTSFGPGGFLTAWDEYKNKRFCPSIEIGTNCYFGAMHHITAINRITIGNHVLAGKWVTITDNNHGNVDADTLKIHPLDRPLVSAGPVEIADDVWIGDKVTILANVKIGKGAVIGANSVVTKDVEPYTVVAGNPARRIK